MHRAPANALSRVECWVGWHGLVLQAVGGGMTVFSRLHGLEYQTVAPNKTQRSSRVEALIRFEFPDLGSQLVELSLKLLEQVRVASIVSGRGGGGVYAVVF